MASNYLLSIKSGLSSQFVATGSTSVHSNRNMFTTLVISILVFHFKGVFIIHIFFVAILQAPYMFLVSKPCNV